MITSIVTGSISNSLMQEKMDERLKRYELELKRREQMNELEESL